MSSAEEIISMQLAALSALLVFALVPMGVLAAQADPGLFDLQSEEKIALREEQGSTGTTSLQKMQQLKQKALHQASREVHVKQQRKVEQANSNRISDGNKKMAGIVAQVDFGRQTNAMGKMKTFTDTEADYSQTTAKTPTDAMVQGIVDMQKKNKERKKADAKDAQAKGYKGVANWHAKYAADHSGEHLEVKREKAKIEAKLVKAEAKKVQAKALRSEEISHNPKKPNNAFMRHHPGAAKAEMALDANLQAMADAKLKPKGAKQPEQPKHKSVDQKVQAAKPAQGKQQTFMKEGKKQTFMKVSKDKPAKLGASQDTMNNEEIKAKAHAYTEALRHGASQGAMNIDEIKAKGRTYMEALRHGATPSAAAEAADVAVDAPPSHASVTPIQ